MTTKPNLSPTTKYKWNQNLEFLTLKCKIFKLIDWLSGPHSCCLTRSNSSAGSNFVQNWKLYGNNRLGHLYMCSPVVSLFFHFTLGITHYFPQASMTSLFPSLLTSVTQNKSILLQWVKHFACLETAFLLFGFKHICIHSAVFKQMYIGDTFIELAMVAENVLLFQRICKFKTSW